MSHDCPAISADQEPYIGHYELLNALGQGSFGKVTLGRHLLTGTMVAVKAICTQQGYFRFQSHQQEAECMAVLHHPHIVQLFEVIVTKNVFYLIMEHVSAGDLRNHLQTNRVLPEQEARGIFRQLVSAVHHCHMKGIIHRDIKPSNVLLGPDMTVKLADFGLSVPFCNRKFSSFRGSRFYAAPEVFSARKYEGPPVDIWSLGVLLYRMVTGTLPFKDKDWLQLKKLIQRGRYTVPSYLSSQLQHLLTKLITIDPKKRSNLEDVMPDPWINQGKEELRPYNEAPSEDLDPWVTQKMVDMGFQLNWIQHALNNKTYDYVMATYFMLKREKPEVQVSTIQVRPYCSPDLNSRHPSPPGEVQPECSRQQHEAQGTGQKGKESVGPAASRTSRTASSGPRLESRMASSRRSSKSRTASPGPSLEFRTASAQHSSKSRTASPRPSPQFKNTSPKPELKSRTATPRPSWKSRTSTFRSLPESELTTTPQPNLEAERRIATPPPSLESKTITPSTAPLEGSSSSHRSNSSCSTCSKCHICSTCNSHQTPEGHSQGWRGVARRCLHFIRKLCCKPCKKGRVKCNRVMPL